MGHHLTVVVDHLSGSRRGQRQIQVLQPGSRLRFGRHPDSDVSFDAQRDLDASSRHAELRAEGAGFVLFDTGSSNGTFVGGVRISQIAIDERVPTIVQFGLGGPRLRLFLGDSADAPEVTREDLDSAHPLVVSADDSPGRDGSSALRWYLLAMAAAVISLAVWRLAL